MLSHAGKQQRNSQGGHNKQVNYMLLIYKNFSFEGVSSQTLFLIIKTKTNNILKDNSL